MRFFSAKRLCVSVEDIDFINPPNPSEGRECGVRLEVRLAETDTDPASIYASRAVSIGRGVCRVDLLETAPNAQDRMHWHPRMPDGEPGDRIFEEELRDNPLKWLSDFLRDGVETLRRAGIEDPERYEQDAKELRRISDLIVADATAGLQRYRSTRWPEVERDHRGMALVG